MQHADPNFHTKKLFLQDRGKKKKKKSQTDILGINTFFWQSWVVCSEICEHPLLPTVWSREATGVFQCTLPTASAGAAAHNAHSESCSPPGI